MKRWIFLIFFCLVFFLNIRPVQAAEGSVLGIHILHPYELENVVNLVKTDDDSWHYVTLPLSFADLQNKDQWQAFFDKAKTDKIIPIVRLVTEFDSATNAWKIPTRREIVSQVDFLNSLNWPTDQRLIIIYNEPNHAAEWGGIIDPASYADTLKFASAWAHTSNDQFKVLPAGLDLAANSSSQTREAFSYLNEMIAADPDVFTYFDYWNSHSYPNPGFSAAPTRTGQNSLRGFEYELAYLKNKTGKDFQVFITETGWLENPSTSRWLESYYTYALQHIWSDARVVAVTPFLLQGDPGPFSQFSFFDKDGQPTLQYTAYRNALAKILGG